MDTNTQKIKTNKNIFRDPLNLLIFVSLFATFILWYVVQMLGKQEGLLNQIFALMLGVTPFLASFKGLKASQKWGGMASVTGKAIISLSIGLLLWSLGEFVWTYYIVTQPAEIPYPSLADVGYATGVVFWIISTLYLARLAGVGALLKHRPWMQLSVAAVLVGSLALSYYLLVTVSRGGEISSDGSSLLKTVFDFWYPLTSMVSLSTVTVVALVSGRYLGGLLMTPILLVLGGLFGSYLYDLSFSYTTTQETYFNGHANDMLLIAATGLLSLSLVFFAQRSIQSVSRTTPPADAEAPKV